MKNRKPTYNLVFHDSLGIFSLVYI